MRRALTVSLLGMLVALVMMQPRLSRQLLAETKKDAAPEPKIKVGDTAPDFTLKDQSGKEVSLHDFKDKKNVVLAFYIFAFTGG